MFVLGGVSKKIQFACKTTYIPPCSRVAGKKKCEGHKQEMMWRDAGTQKS